MRPWKNFPWESFSLCIAKRENAQHFSWSYMTECTKKICNRGFGDL